MHLYAVAQSRRIIAFHFQIRGSDDVPPLFDDRLAEAAFERELQGGQKKVKESKRTLKIANVTPEIRQVFKVTGLEKIFEIYETSEEAKTAFTKKGFLFWKK